MPALIGAGVSNQQLLAVWATNGDTGFTPAQLLTAGITIAEMRSNSIPDYLLFNQACNTPLSSGTAPGPIMRLLSTDLNATNTHVRLEGKGEGSVRWTLPGIQDDISFIQNFEFPNDTRTRGNVTGEYIRDEGRIVVSILNIPLSHVLSNLTLTLIDTHARATSIQLCPGR